MKSRILILLIAYTCMCTLSVAGSTKHGDVSKTEIKPSWDMSHDLNALVPAMEFNAEVIAHMSLNAETLTSTNLVSVQPSSFKTTKTSLLIICARDKLRFRAWHGPHLKR